MNQSQPEISDTVKRHMVIPRKSGITLDNIITEQANISVRLDQVTQSSYFSGPSGGWSSWTAFGSCDSQCKHRRQRFCASHDLQNCPGADVRGIETQIEDCKEKCFGKHSFPIVNHEDL